MDMTMYELRPAATPRRVLVVDDDPDFRGMLGIAFARAGFTVHEAANGRIALDILRDQTVELIVTDIIMPEADGYEIILKLKTRTPRPPLIAVTGGSVRLRMELPNMARLLGADAAFEKPLDLDCLLSEAARLVGAHRKGPVLCKF